MTAARMQEACRRLKPGPVSAAARWRRNWKERASSIGTASWKSEDACGWRPQYNGLEASTHDGATAGDDATQVINLAEMPVQMPVQMDQELLGGDGSSQDCFGIFGGHLFRG